MKRELQPILMTNARREKLDAMIRAESSRRAILERARAHAQAIARAKRDARRRVVAERMILDDQGNAYFSMQHAADALGVQPSRIRQAIADNLPIIPRGQHRRRYLQFGPVQLISPSIPSASSESSVVNHSLRRSA